MQSMTVQYMLYLIRSLCLPFKVTASLGRCLHLLSDHTRPDSALQWSTESCTVTDDLSEPIEGEDVEMAPQILSGAKYGALSSVMRQNEAEMAEVCLLRYICVALPERYNTICSFLTVILFPFCLPLV